MRLPTASGSVSPASQQVAHLERRLGVRLFDRSSTGMRPTDAGRRLADIAAQTVRTMGGLRRMATSVRRIGVPRGVEGGVLDALESRFGAATEFVALDSSRAKRALGRDVDAAIVRGPVSPPTPRIVSNVLRAAPLGVLLGGTHVLATRKEIEWSELAGQSLLWFDEHRAPEYAAWLLGFCRAHGWRPRLRRLDPAGTRLVTNALRREADLVALRPEGDACLKGLTWVPLVHPIHRRSGSYSFRECPCRYQQLSTGADGADSCR